MILLSSVVLLALGAGIVAVPIANEAAKAAVIRPRYLERTVHREILQYFPDPSGEKEIISEPFSRMAPIYQMKSRFTLAWVEHAPEGIAGTDKIMPFEILGQPAYAKDAPPVMLWGYVDGNTRVVHVYLAAESKYVAAGEHPFIKAGKEQLLPRAGQPPAPAPAVAKPA